MSSTDAAAFKRGRPASLTWAGFALGFGLGGFFDGILLHQILQWHHLLSGWQEGRDLRILVLGDGLFHVAMYVITCVGLWALWQNRMHLPAAGRYRLLAAGLLGFGVWHITDGILVHWILGMHRIRMDTPNPLLWDLLWLAVFGIVPVVAGWRLGGKTDGSGGRAVAAVLVLATLAAGGMNMLPASNSQILVVFRPGVSPAQAAAAILSAEGRIVATDPTQQLWAVDLPDDASRIALYGRGALLVSDGILPAGCLTWMRLPAA